ncbi:MAG: DUF87 domain-containing protein, partial [Pseudomonadota bacterium]
MQAPNTEFQGQNGTAEPLSLGRLVSVTGGQAVVLLDNPEEHENHAQLIRPDIGTLLKVDTPTSVILGLVSASSAPMPSHNTEEPELRVVEVEFIGELLKRDDGSISGFKRGISRYPGLGDPVLPADQEELSKAYECGDAEALRIGCIQQDPSIPAMVKIDDLLGKHFAVLGTTGTGKSCSVALFLHRIIEHSPNAHIVVLDVHREYGGSFKDCAEIITPHNLTLPFWLLTFEELVEIICGDQPNRDTDMEVLRDLIPAAKTRYAANQRKDRKNRLSKVENDNLPIGVDTPVPYRVSDLTGLLDEFIGKLDMRNDLAPFKRIKARVEHLSRDPRYGFLFGSLTVQVTMADVFGRLFRIPVNGKPFTILELGGLP